jgi:hypothetical protein
LEKENYNYEKKTPPKTKKTKREGGKEGGIGRQPIIGNK